MQAKAFEQLQQDVAALSAARSTLVCHDLAVGPAGSAPEGLVQFMATTSSCLQEHDDQLKKFKVTAIAMHDLLLPVSWQHDSATHAGSMTIVGMNVAAERCRSMTIAAFYGS